MMLFGFPTEIQKTQGFLVFHQRQTKKPKTPSVWPPQKGLGLLDFWLFGFPRRRYEKLSPMKSMRFDGIYNEKEAEVGHGGVCPYIYIYICATPAPLQSPRNPLF